MQIFAVLSPTENVKLEEAISTTFDKNFLKIGPGQWFIADGRTTTDISNILKVTDGTNGPAIIVSVSSYYGRAATNIWE